MITFGINVNKSKATLTLNTSKKVGFARSLFIQKKIMRINSDIKATSKVVYTNWRLKCLTLF